LDGNQSLAEMEMSVKLNQWVNLSEKPTIGAVLAGAV
jgi:hypothetical protein